MRLKGVSNFVHAMWYSRSQYTAEEYCSMSITVRLER